MNNVKVVLSDSHILFREGMNIALSGEEGINVIGETYDNSKLYDFLLDNTPDIVFVGITDYWQKDLNLISHIRHNLPSISIIVVLNEKDGDKIASAIACGISAYITRDISQTHLLDLVKSIAQGSLPIIDAILIPDVASSVLDNFSWIANIKTNLKVFLKELSPEEKSILTQVSSQKQTSRGIRNADKLAIMDNLQSIRNKLIENYISKMLLENTNQDVFFSIAPDIESHSIQYVTKEEFEKFKESLVNIARGLNKMIDL